MRRACDNPFAVHRVLGIRYKWGEQDWADLHARLRQAGNRGAIVGPHGSGKTTLLEDLSARLIQQNWRVAFVRMNSERRGLAEAFAQCPASLEPRDFVLVDGAEQLGSIAWPRFRFHVRQAGGLVITTHRPGRLRTLCTCETTAQRLGEIVADLGVNVSEVEIAALYRAHRGNLREALRSLYDRWADDGAAEVKGRVTPTETERV
jgi:energy-coupling factor transporter ATP-binding protein EcfA2